MSLTKKIQVFSICLHTTSSVTTKVLWFFSTLCIGLFRERQRIVLMLWSWHGDTVNYPQILFSARTNGKQTCIISALHNTSSSNGILLLNHSKKIIFVLLAGLHTIIWLCWSTNRGINIIQWTVHMEKTTLSSPVTATVWGVMLEIRGVRLLS